MLHFPVLLIDRDRLPIPADRIAIWGRQNRSQRHYGPCHPVLPSIWTTLPPARYSGPVQPRGYDRHPFTRIARAMPTPPVLQLSVDEWVAIWRDDPEAFEKAPDNLRDDVAFVLRARQQDRATPWPCYQRLLSAAVITAAIDLRRRRLKGQRVWPMELANAASWAEELIGDANPEAIKDWITTEPEPATHTFR